MAGTASDKRVQLGIGGQVALALLSLCAGIAPLAARWIADEGVRLGYGVLLTVVYLAVTLAARRITRLEPFWELSFAFVLLAIVQVLNNFIPPLVAIHVLHAPPASGNPLASTVSGTVIIQLLETAMAIVPIVLLIWAAGLDLGTVYARAGATGVWLLAPAASFLVFTAAVVSHRAGRFIPTNGPVSSHQLVVWAPALLVMVIANGFQEEFLFRGLFLQRYAACFGARIANLLQGIVFATAHAGISYTPGAVLFIVLLVFPIGLLCGYLMRRTNGVVVPALFHAGFDIPIFVAFLTYCLG